MQPLVSIIIPVYNGVNFLAQAIDSALNQTYPSIEVLVVDDGSTDSTREIIHSYGSRIIPIWKENGGVASALNVGIQQARGEYIAWLSHDDMFLPYKIERQVEFFIRNPSYNFCYGNYIVVDEKGTKLYEVKSSQLSGYKARQQLLISSYIHGCTTLIHRNCFEKVGLFNEKLPHTQDTDLWIRISEHYELGYINETLILSRLHTEQGSSSHYKHIIHTINFYNYILEEKNIALFFPLSHSFPQQPSQYKAYKYSWLADIVMIHRQWYAYAVSLFNSSISFFPSILNLAWLKIFFAKILLHIQGNELDVFPNLYEAIRLMKQKRNREAQPLIFNVLSQYPFNGIALYLLIKNWITMLLQSFK